MEASAQNSDNNIKLKPLLFADPNPVPSGPGLGSTNITWQTGDDSIGQVFVYTPTQGEQLVIAGEQGNVQVDWIETGKEYEFRLYSPDYKLLATHQLKRNQLVIGESEVLDSMIFNKISKTRKHMWLIAAPKSGSTWLSRILLNYLIVVSHLLYFLRN